MQITITDPQRPSGGGDVLGQDEEVARSGRGRWVLAGALGLALAVGVGPERGEGPGPAPGPSPDLTALQKELTVRLESVSGRGEGVLAVLVEVGSSTGSQSVSERVSMMTVEGPGLTSGAYPDGALSGTQQLEVQQLEVRASAACDEVARGVIPSEARVRLQISTRSGGGRTEERALDSLELRRAVLESCGVPDPAAETRLESSSFEGHLLVQVTGAPRAGEVVVSGVGVAGWEVTPIGITLPHSVREGETLVMEVEARVTDCARARRQQPVLVVSGRDLRGAFVRQTSPVTAPTPDEASASYVLARRLAETCR